MATYHPSQGRLTVLDDVLRAARDLQNTLGAHRSELREPSVHRSMPVPMPPSEAELLAAAIVEFVKNRRDFELVALHDREQNHVSTIDGS